MVAFGGVVVDDVEDDFDSGGVQRLDHLFELVDLLAQLAAGGIFVVRREKADRVVAPVIAQPALEQVRVVHELVDRHQFHGRHAQALQIIHGGRMRQAGVRPAHLLRHVGMALCEALDVQLVDDRFVQRDLGAQIVAPRKRRVDHDRTRHERRAVGGVRRAVRIAEVVGKDRRIPLNLPADRLGVGIEQPLGVEAAVPLHRIPRAVNPIAVTLTGPDRLHITAPAMGDAVVHLKARLAPLLVDQAQVHPFGDLGENGEVGAMAVIGRPQGIRLAGKKAQFAHRNTKACMLGSPSFVVNWRVVGCRDVSLAAPSAKSGARGRSDPSPAGLIGNDLTSRVGGRLARAPSPPRANASPVPNREEVPIAPPAEAILARGNGNLRRATWSSSEKAYVVSLHAETLTMSSLLRSLSRCRLLCPLRPFSLSASPGFRGSGGRRRLRRGQNFCSCLSNSGLIPTPNRVM
ncbi:MAG: hypothetical protein BWZ08_01406 [candidate division BRC1 bacterium ADurb.BinA292]|nr:MAG: hypothetical protein BWZ08_01406 [candidate division BRC1 bacterium ADurb.BinA292]